MSCPAPTSASESENPTPVVALPRRKNAPICPAKRRVATIAAKPADAIAPMTSASNPARLRSTAEPAAVPTLRTSAAATPSGYGSDDCATSARRSGTLYITPSMPPSAQIPKESANGKPLHHPIITKPGSTKIIAESVPAADATVCTMLFSKIVALRTARRTAMEITAAGIVDANVRPTLSPR